MNKKVRLFFLTGIIALTAGIFSAVFNYIVYSGTQISTQLMENGQKWIIIIPFIILLLYMLIRKSMEKYDTNYGVRAVQCELENIKSQVMTIPHVASKLFLTAISICGGFAVGSFGPTAHIGGAIGSQVAYKDKTFDDDMKRVLIAAGTAAALSAVYKNPLFSAVFVMEVILEGAYFKHIIPILYASVLSTIVEQILTGANRSYSIINTINPLGFKALEINFSMIISIFLISIVVGMIGGLYIFLLSKFNLLYKKSDIKKRNLLTISTVLFTILLSLKHLDFMYLNTDLILKGPFLLNDLWFLVPFLFLKLFLSTSQQGFGLHGGNFTPGLYFGILTGMILYTVLNFINLELPSYSVVLLISSACVIGAFANAPLSAVVLAVEIYNHSSIIIPVIIAVIISYAASRTLVKKSVRFY